MVRIILEQYVGHDAWVTIKEKDGFLHKGMLLSGIKDNTSYEDTCNIAIQYCLENLI